MKHTFPVITHIDQVKAAIAGNELFSVLNKGDYQIVSYMLSLPITFPDLNEEGITDQERERRKILRECRGITFDMEGNVVRRPFEKFFNYGEKLGEVHNFDITKPHVVMTKRDGSAISPFMINGELRYGTKRGVTDVSAQAVSFISKPGNDKYNVMSIDLIRDNFTPIFEWCSLKQQIVIPYENDELVLLAVRNMTTGDYMSYEDLAALGQKYDISVVETHSSITDVSEFIAHTRDLKGMEGYVVDFGNYRVKLKAEEYCKLHSVVSSTQSERQVVSLFLDDAIDDVIPMLPEEISKRLLDFAKKIAVAVDKMIKDAKDHAQSHIDGGMSRKDYAALVLGNNNMKPLGFLYMNAFQQLSENKWDYEIMFKKWHQVASNNLRKNIRIEENRFLIGGNRWLETDMDA